MNRRSFVAAATLGSAAVLFGTKPASASPRGTASAAAGFVTRDATTGNLMLDGQRYRWGGCNTGGLGLSENNNAYGGTVVGGLYYPPHPEIEAVIGSAQAMNVRVIRSGACLTVGCAGAIQPSLGVFNEDAFEPVDYALSLCAARGIKLIFPMVDNYQYFAGGKFTYCTLNGVTPDFSATQFFTNETVKASFKNHVSAVLNHTNRYTGIKYKDDPTILAWETGNELAVAGDWIYSAWTDEVSRHIKLTEGAQQLVVDGHYGIWKNSALDVDTDSLNLPYVDIYSEHTYDNFRSPQYIVDVAQTVHSYSKAFILGEYTWTDRGVNGFGLSWTLTQMLSAIAASPYVDGDLFWELLAPLTNHGGGFTLHWPGDNADMVTRADQLARRVTTV